MACHVQRTVCVSQNPYLNNTCFEVVKLNNGLNNKDTEAVSSLLFTDVTGLRGDNCMLLAHGP